MATFTRRMLVAGALSVTVFGARAWAQYSTTEPKEPKKDSHTHGTAADKPAMGKSTASMKAELVEPEKKAKAQAATVKVEVTGIEIVDPATTNEMAKAGQGHLHYTVDNNPTVATTTKKLSFHGLSSGKHTIKVVLAGNDHAPLGPQQTLEVTVP